MEARQVAQKLGLRLLSPEEMIALRTKDSTAS